ncbi:DinB family protein [Flaviflexus salsibiostraticola]|uniref:DinB family protein n=1 Tax=Flaviflexus salsibiostraticola TaxID=1282737 RepID=UPI001B875145|nr:DinB family protein [Flaviflexus salsibiostraticola]
MADQGGKHLVNGVDVIPLVDAELNRRFPGRELTRAHAPEDLRRAWAALEATWSATVAQALSLPESALAESVDDEWSFSQTLRHLVFATDIWLGRAILGSDDFHPLGLEPVDDVVADDEGVSFDDILTARSDRQARVRDYLEDVTEEQLDELRDNPHGSGTRKPVRSCLHTILEEEWEHHRYAVRDLAILMA